MTLYLCFASKKTKPSGYVNTLGLVFLKGGAYSPLGSTPPTGGHSFMEIIILFPNAKSIIENFLSI